MFNIIVSKPIARMVAAASVASVVAFAAMAAPGADHIASQAQAATQPNASADTSRLRVPTRGNACSVHGWPNFEPKCQFDLREPAAEARTIRVIALR